MRYRWLQRNGSARGRTGGTAGNPRYNERFGVNLLATLGGGQTSQTCQVPSQPDRGHFEAPTMLVNANYHQIPDGKIEGHAADEEWVDTSDLLEQLRERFRKRQRKVEVDFRQLVHWVRLGDQLTHQIHPYPAKLLPHIAHFFARASILSQPGEVVLDPFCGSGTVALEATLAGRVAFAADANPLALLVARVKTRPYDPQDLRATLSTLVMRVRRLRSPLPLAIVNDHLWYTPEKKHALGRLARVVEELADGHLRDFFRVCFSVTARRVSNADPAISVPVRLKAKSTFAESTSQKVTEKLEWIANADPIEEFRRICEANIARVQETNDAYPKRRNLELVGNDARALKAPGGTSDLLPGGSVPLVITSPPYGSAQKYIRASSLSLNWLGLAAPDELSSLEEASIGREHMPKRWVADLPKDLPKSFERLLSRIERVNRTRMLITRQYLHDMRMAFREMARVLRPGGHVVLVIGNNQVCGESLRNDAFAKLVFDDAGLSLDLDLVDDIKSRGLMTKRNKTASMISRECVLVFKKRGG